MTLSENLGQTCTELLRLVETLDTDPQWVPVDWLKRQLGGATNSQYSTNSRAEPVVCPSSSSTSRSASLSGQSASLSGQSASSVEPDSVVASNHHLSISVEINLPEHTNSGTLSADENNEKETPVRTPPRATSAVDHRQSSGTAFVVTADNICLISPDSPPPAISTDCANWVENL